MKDEQFSELMRKLEEIRCGIIDVESATENSQPKSNGITPTTLRENFFAKLEERTGWGRNQIKAAFDEALAECM